MKKLYILLILFLITSTLLFNCQKKTYDRVNPYDPLSANYTAPKGTEKEILTPPVDPNLGVLKFNNSTSSSFYVTTSTNAKIVLTDPNLSGESNAINIKSETDTTGITLYLKKSGSTYTNTLNFSTAGSVENSTIEISDQDTVTATYNDLDPTGTVTATATWFDQDRQYWIWANAGNDFPYGVGGNLWQWGSPAPTWLDDTTDFPTGCGPISGKLTINGTGGGWYWDLGGATDFTLYKKRFLQFWIKANVDVEVKIEQGANTVSKGLISEYGLALDNTWQFVSIPLSDFSSQIDFSALTVVMGFHYSGSAVFSIDELRFDTR